MHAMDSWRVAFENLNIETLGVGGGPPGKHPRKATGTRFAINIDVPVSDCTMTAADPNTK